MSFYSKSKNKFYTRSEDIQLRKYFHKLVIENENLLINSNDINNYNTLISLYKVRLIYIIRKFINN